MGRCAGILSHPFGRLFFRDEGSGGTIRIANGIAGATGTSHKGGQNGERNTPGRRRGEPHRKPFFHAPDIGQVDSRD